MGGRYKRAGSRPGEAGVPIARPLHRRPYGVPVAEEDIVAHPDLVPVVDDGRAWHAHGQAVQELNAGLSFSIMEARRRRMPTFTRIRGSVA